MAMTTSEYLETPKGQYNRYYWGKVHGYSYYIFDREPPGKAAKKPQKAKFQQEILEKMKEQNRRSYRSKIAAEIWLEPSSETPPHIHTAMKKLLDIFSTPKKESGIKRKGLIYQDDKQISYLSVRYHAGSEEKGIHAKFAPFRDFIANFKLAYDILSGDYDDYIDLSEFKREIKELNIYSNDHYFSDPIEELRQYEDEKENYLKHLSKQAYNSMHLLKKMEAQEYLLDMSKLSINNLYKIFNTSKLFQKNPRIREISKIPAEWVTKSPIRLELPELPTKDGQKKQYREKIRKSMRNSLNHYELLEPLYIPVIIEVIYKPPIDSAGFYKDLDNILGDFIIPIFHDEFRPPPIQGAIFNSTEYEEDANPMSYERKDVPKSVPYSVAGYEIVEIPRDSIDKEDGFLVVGISPGSYASHSLWHKIDTVIEKWGECILDTW